MVAKAYTFPKDGEPVRKTRKKAYDGITKDGASAKKAARIANAGKTKAARSRMAKKGWRTRRRRK